MFRVYFCALAQLTVTSLDDSRILARTIVPGMPKRVDQPAIQLNDDENNTFHAVWSRTGNLIVSIAPQSTFGKSWEGQAVLTPDQTERLRTFLVDGPK